MTSPTIFGLVIRPIFISLDKNLVPAENELKQHLLKNFCRNKYEVFIFKGQFINAYATGVLPFSRSIVLGESIVQKLNPKELEAIFTHEMGHLVLNHIKYVLGIALICAPLIATSVFFITDISNEFLKILLILCNIVFFAVLIPSIVQRKLEYQADKFGAKQVGVEIYIKALKKIDSLSKGMIAKGDLQHATLEKRVKFLENL